MIEPGSYGFAVTCNASAIIGTPTQSCNENVSVTVDPGGGP
jgi:hypothetical protein